MAEIKVQILAKNLIKPLSPTPATLQNTNLPLFDLLAPSSYINIIFYYNNSPTNHTKPHDQIHKQLQTSLSDALTTFYPLAGRYVKDNQSIICNDRGVGYTATRVEGPSMVEFLHLRDRVNDLDQFLPQQSFSGHYPDDDDDDESSSVPFLAIQVNVFECGGLAIGVCFWHKIADTFAAVQFINSWAETNRLGEISTNSSRFQSSSFGVESFFPVKNFPVEMPPVKHDPELKMLKRFVFYSDKISSVRAEFDGPPPSRVTLVTAVLWKALMHTRHRARCGAKIRNEDFSLPHKTSLLSPAFNLRGRTPFPACNDSSGNFWTPFVSRFKPNNDITTLAWQDLVRPITEAVQSMADLVQNASSDEISLATIDAFKEVQETMAREDEEVDVFICSSWCRFAVYEADFGWGKPAWVSTGGRPMEAFILMDSSNGDNAIEAWVCLSKLEMQLLEQDSDIIDYCTEKH